MAKEKLIPVKFPLPSFEKDVESAPPEDAINTKEAISNDDQVTLQTEEGGTKTQDVESVPIDNNIETEPQEDISQENQAPINQVVPDTNQSLIDALEIFNNNIAQINRDVQTQISDHTTQIIRLLFQTVKQLYLASSISEDEFKSLIGPHISEIMQMQSDVSFTIHPDSKYEATIKEALKEKNFAHELVIKKDFAISQDGTFIEYNNTKIIFDKTEFMLKIEDIIKQCVGGDFEPYDNDTCSQRNEPDDSKDAPSSKNA